MQVKLLVVGGEVKTKEVRLRLPTVIGRGEGATLLLPHPLVSRKHCELFEAHGRLVVRDLGSLNGTYVNNEKITESVVEPGELLTIGSVTFRADYEVAQAESTKTYAVPKADEAPEFAPVKKPPAGRSTAKTDEIAPKQSPARVPPAVTKEPDAEEFTADEAPEDDAAAPPNPDGAPPEESGDYGLAPPDAGAPSKGQAAEDPSAEEEPADDGPDDDDLSNFLKNLKR